MPYEQIARNAMQLTTKARYGLRALCHVAHRGYASAQVIAEKQAIPSRYLEEIIGELRKAGFVIGKRGPRGGYKLARPANEIILADVLSVLSSSNQSNAGEPQDEITSLVERAVDGRMAQLVGGLNLEDLISEAREQFRRLAADYVI